MFKWFINNVRRGFATNSSSSHSMVHYREPVASDSLQYGEVEFGWDHFKLDTLGGKLMYALVAHVSRLGGDWYTRPTSEQVDEAYKEFGDLFPEFDRQDFYAALQGYIDHQSYAPADHLLKAARDPHIVIHGGNDNDGMNAWELAEQYADSKEVDWVSHIDTPEDKIMTEGYSNEDRWKW